MSVTEPEDADRRVLEKANLLERIPAVFGRRVIWMARPVESIRMSASMNRGP